MLHSSCSSSEPPAFQRRNKNSEKKKGKMTLMGSYSTVVKKKMPEAQAAQTGLSSTLETAFGFSCRLTEKEPFVLYIGTR